MNRQQLGISVAAFTFVVILFSLPKVLLNKEEKEIENSIELDKKDPNSVSKSPSKHTNISFSEAEKKKLANWKLSLMKASGFKEESAMVDSISILYNSKALYDSSALFTEKALSKYPTAESWAMIGDACYKAYYFSADDGKASEWGNKTQEYYKKALELKPDLLDLKARMAMTYTRSSNPMQAALTLREVLEKDPNNEQALLNMGLLSIQSGQFDKAITRFSKLLSLNPENWLATFYLGISLAEKGKKKEAKECFEKVKRNEKQTQIVEAADEYLKQLSVNP